MELGYIANNAEYTALRDEIKKVRKQLKSDEDTTSVFAGIKEKLASLTRRRSEKQVRAEAPKEQGSEKEKRPEKVA